MYCRKCRRIFDGALCPECGKDKWIGTPNPEDPCFLTERGAPWDGMLKDVLDQNGIPHLDQSRMGAAIGQRAPLLQSNRIYVRYDDLARANELVDELFGPDAPR